MSKSYPKMSDFEKLKFLKEKLKNAQYKKAVAKTVISGCKETIKYTKQEIKRIQHELLKEGGDDE